jgi:hypothetical protein
LYGSDFCHSAFQASFSFSLCFCLDANMLLLTCFLRYLGRSVLSELDPSAAALASLSAFSLPLIPTWPAVQRTVRLYFLLPSGLV